MKTFIIFCFLNVKNISGRNPGEAKPGKKLIMNRLNYYLVLENPVYIGLKKVIGEQKYRRVVNYDLVRVVPERNVRGSVTG